MDKKPISDVKIKAGAPPSPEVLRPQSDKGGASSISTAASASKLRNRLYHTSYRPSHKATFIGLAVVVVILGLNAAVIVLLMRNGESSTSQLDQGQVTVNAEVLNGLGVNNANSDAGALLTVNPNASFKGTLTIAGDTSVAGKLNLNGKLSTSDASISKLEAGDTSLQSLNVNGDATSSNMNLRGNLIVAGTTTTNGPVTMGGLLTVSDNINVTGNLSVGGTLSMGAFQTNTLTVGGHIITRGDAPGLTRGAALGALDTVSISGSDAAGTVAVNIGVTPRSGIVANVTFVNAYSGTPRVIVTAVGPGATDVYVNRNANGFSIGVGSISNGGHAFDFIVVQ